MAPDLNEIFERAKQKEFEEQEITEPKYCFGCHSKPCACFGKRHEEKLNEME